MRARRRMTDVVSQLQREMDSMMDMFGFRDDPFFSRSPLTMLDRLAAFPRTSSPAVGRLVPFEFSEDESTFTLKLEVPGFAKGDIKVRPAPCWLRTPIFAPRMTPICPPVARLNLAERGTAQVGVHRQITLLCRQSL